MRKDEGRLCFVFHALQKRRRKGREEERRGEEERRKLSIIRGAEVLLFYNTVIYVCGVMEEEKE